MRILVLSDIHANLTALEAVLAQAAGEWDYIWCLGDVVGYGPDPNECVERLRELPHLCLLGNHDWAALCEMDLQHFNEDASRSLSWTQENLQEDNADYLRRLPMRRNIAAFTLVHASPREPTWEYIMGPAVAARNFAHFETPYCLVGHTHHPVIFEQAAPLADEPTVTALAQVPLGDSRRSLNGGRLILNPGSVGQPRDADPAAAYALLDTEKECWEQRRTRYAVHEVQARMRAHGLPERLVQRLAYGF